MVLVDSSVWINYFNGAVGNETDLLDYLLQETPILMGDLILTEVLQGFTKDIDYRKAREILSILPFRELGGFEVAVRSAENYRFLRKNGVTVRKTIDIIIGTFCLINDIPLLHDDKDFTPMEKYLSLKTI